ncbi:MAG: helix-turn-helix transcriptional regulator [Ruminiclostridium sp.]
MRKNWTQQEIQYLIENWNTTSLKKIMEQLDRTEDSVMRKVRRVGLNVCKLENEKLKRKWSKEEDQIIIEYYKVLAPINISNQIKRSVSAIRKRAIYLGVADKVTRWSTKEEELLKEKWGISNLDTIAKRLNRSKNSITLKAYQMSLREQINANGLYFTPTDISKILNVNIRTLYSWMRNGLIIFKKFKVGKKTKYQITVDSFCSFIKNYQSKWNSEEADIELIKCYYVSYFICEDGSLTIKEGSIQWLEEKIKRDIREYRKQMKPWTTFEEKELLRMLEEGYSHKEICSELGRSMSSTKTRIYMLKRRVN